MSNSEKGTKNSGTQATSYITKTTFFPAARIKNVELIGSLIGGSADPTNVTFYKIYHLGHITRI